MRSNKDVMISSQARDNTTNDIVALKRIRLDNDDEVCFGIKINC